MDLLAPAESDDAEAAAIVLYLLINFPNNKEITLRVCQTGPAKISGGDWFPVVTSTSSPLFFQINLLTDFANNYFLKEADLFQRAVIMQMSYTDNEITVSHVEIKNQNNSWKQQQQ